MAPQFCSCHSGVKQQIEKWGEMQINLTELKDWSTIVAMVVGAGSTLIGAIIAIAKLVQKIRDHGKRLELAEVGIKALSSDIRRRLYNGDSQPVYVPVKRCEKLQEKCTMFMSKELARVHQKLDLLLKVHVEEK